MPECTRNTNDGCPVNNRLSIRVKDLTEGAAGAQKRIDELRSQVELLTIQQRQQEKLPESPIHKMKLHEELFPNRSGLLKITRVPGGWIYTTYQGYQMPYDPNSGQSGEEFRISSVFVPYDDEFKGDKADA